MYKRALLMAGGLAAAVLWFATPTPVQAGGYYYDDYGYYRYHYNPPVRQHVSNSWAGSRAYRDGYYHRRVVTPYRHSDYRGSHYNRYNRRSGWYSNNHCY